MFPRMHHNIRTFQKLSDGCAVVTWLKEVPHFSRSASRLGNLMPRLNDGKSNDPALKCLHYCINTVVGMKFLIDVGDVVAEGARTNLELIRNIFGGLPLS